LQSLKYEDIEYKVDDKFKIEIPDYKKQDKNNDRSNNIFS